jgi:hypothetical protein
MEKKVFFAGAAKVDITPILGTVINGDFIPHFANYIHDPLYAKALVLDDNATRLAIIVVDICVMGQEFIGEVKNSIEKELGIDPRHVLISSTHTHAAGAVEEVHLVNADWAYREKLPGLILRAVALAKSKLQPAKIAFSSVHVPEHVLCRRYYMKEGFEAINPLSGGLDSIKTNPFGAENQIIRPVAEVDPELSFMAIKNLDHQWISIFGNYSLHYVGDWENGSISADYFGIFSQALGDLLSAGEDFVGIMSNGTSGDINVLDFMDPDRYPKPLFEKSRLIGEELASKVATAMPALVWDEDPTLAAVNEELRINRRMPQPQELEHAKKIIEKGGLEQVTAGLEGWRKIYAREQLLLSEFDPVAICPLQLFRIGKGIIGGLPGEFFAQTGLEIKKSMASEHYFTIGLANGNLGYVPPLQELERGGYETWRCRISNLESGAEGKIRNGLVKMRFVLD